MPENPSSSSNVSSRFEAVLAEIIRTEEEGRSIDVERYCRSFPEIAERLRDYFRDRAHFAEKVLGSARITSDRVEKPALSDLAPGGQFAGYEIVRVMGRGGMGVVYLARQQKANNRLVALKLIRKDRLELLSQEQRRRWMSRFCDEAKSAARIDHERVVTVYEVGAHEGHPFYAMRYIEGQSLAEKLESGLLPNRQAALLMEQVARAVQAIHDHNVKHRDLKPHNILVDAQGRPYVTDFGLAKCADAEESLTQTGEMLGSPAYMSPEQAQDSSKVTNATDIYGLGATLYALLTGQPPFSGKTIAETLDQVKNRDPVPPRQLNSAVDRDLNTITLRCLEKEPERRPRSAAALADAFQFYLEGRPIAFRPVGLGGRLWRWCRRKPALAIMSAATLVLITIAGSLYLAYSAASQSANRAGRELDKQHRKEYGAQMNLVQREYEANNLGRAREVLEAQVPKKAGVTDWRNFEWYYWQRMTLRELLTLQGFGNQGQRVKLTDVTYSPDGRLLAAGGEDRIVRVWDSATGKELHILKGHTSKFTCVAFSPDSQRLTSADEGTVKLWDTMTGKELFSFKAPEGSFKLPTSKITCTAFSPDSRRLTTAVHRQVQSRDRPGLVVLDATVRLWDAVNGKEMLTLKGHTGRIECVAFSPDSRRLATGSSDATLRLWYAETGTALFTLKGHTNEVRSVAFSPDGLRLASSSGHPATVRLWDAVTGKEKFTIQENGAAGHRVHFSPGGRRLILVNHQVRMLDAASGKELFTLKAKEMFAPDGWGAGRIALSPDGRRLATADGPGGLSKGRVRLWDAVTGKELFTLKGHTNRVQSLAFSPDGQRLALCGDDGIVRVWNAVGDQESLILKGHTRIVQVVALSPDGRRLASGGDDATVRLWDAATGKELHTLKEHTNAITSVAFSPDGRKLASADEDVTVYVWDAATGQKLLSLVGNETGVLAVAFSPDGQRVTSVAWDQAVHVWDAATGEKLYTREGATFKMPFQDARTKQRFTRKLSRRVILSAAFSPDGQRLALISHSYRGEAWITYGGPMTGTSIPGRDCSNSRGTPTLSIAWLSV